ncbi:hypothetical protein [Sphingosinicella rhizophila]|uniref:DUF3108 domain-containing protein n=1 Tax=Sphingosinicella rhizophila TaxID=3050082 RepID=A0ABU3Q3U0_9SPHN|nr:hypothetical protein [Sphingosinicella sp. GR2756]MDT9598081.1 hypothetical protein [Sphingosinicella sp. GR2756]
MKHFSLLVAVGFGMAIAIPAESQVPAGEPTYADLADLALAAPVAAHVRIAEAIELEEEQAVGVPPGLARFYVEADLVTLIRSARGLPSRINYLVDMPRDAKGRAPKLRKKAEYILLAAPVSGRPDSLQLVAPDAQLAWTPARGERLRAIVKEAAAADAPPHITGIGRAFHVPGALAGESETQIFLQTEDRQPVSLTVLRRPGQTPQWAVALSEIVDEAAEPPRRETLLWYRLACTLPRALPRQSLAEAGASAAAIQSDYELILDELGPCARNHPGRR